MSIQPIELLVCGRAMDVPEACRDEKVKVLVGLGRLTSSYFNFAVEFKKDLSAPKASYFMPVALRSLMETASIALLARIDPLRVVHSSLVQDSGSYNKSRQQASALKWSGDIVGDDSKQVPAEAKDGKPIEKSSKLLWDPSIGSQKIPRHLLSDHMWKAFWMPSVNNVIGHINNNKQIKSAWIQEFVGIEIDNFQKTIVGNGNQIYCFNKHFA